MMTSPRPTTSLLLTLAVMVAALAACPQEEPPLYATEFTVVELDPAASAPLQLAVQACAGLSNRKLGGSIYVRMEAHDGEWLEELDLTPSEVVDASDFLEACAVEFPACVRYSYADQQELLPSILTAASALEAVPLDEGLSVACEEPAALNSN